MLLDVRTYRMLPGHVPAQLEIYKKYGYPVQLRYMGEPLCYAVAESGELNTFTHVWVYDERRRPRSQARQMFRIRTGRFIWPRTSKATIWSRRKLPDDAGAMGAAGADAQNHQVAAYEPAVVVSPEGGPSIAVQPPSTISALPVT